MPRDPAVPLNTFTEVLPNTLLSCQPTLSGCLREAQQGVSVHAGSRRQDPSTQEDQACKQPLKAPPTASSSATESRLSALVGEEDQKSQEQKAHAESAELERAPQEAPARLMFLGLGFHSGRGQFAGKRQHGRCHTV